MSDFIDSHIRAGLGLRIDPNTVILVPLDAHKDNEFLIISKNLDVGFKKAFHLVYRTYLDHLNVFCWSCGIVWPSMSVQSKEGGLPLMARIGGRGNCQSLMSDVSSLELYVMFNVNSNPFKAMQALQKTAHNLNYV